MGGRVAESLVFDNVSTGASDDLAKATDIARSMVTRYGMYEKLGLATYDEPDSAFMQGFPMPRQRQFSEETAREIDCAVREMLQKAFDAARSILEENRAALDRGAQDLLERETLTGDELPQVVARELPVRSTGPPSPR